MMFSNCIFYTGRKRNYYVLSLIVSILVVFGVKAAEFPRLDEALPLDIIILGQEPVFDFDTDGCYPASGINRGGGKNPGRSISGSLGGGCRDENFLNTSNTLHRYACMESQGESYCGHFYSLYFEKDQISWFFGGHRHDWEHVAVWTINGAITHGSYSAHGNLKTRALSQLPMQGDHIKFVYHKDGVLTHAFRFANSTELAENSYNYWVTPTITSWYQLTGEGISNQSMRNRLNSFDYGSATIPIKDSNFLLNLNDARPPGYPAFTQASIEASR
ncbi:NPP1 family protein [Vibrio coralliilyticus]|uniref:NPP1 family protein n=1 Tax=Vibrio coralliilyticus TaxID=190893 RepID=UPI001E2A4C98|nr:NPP1 family protein [Vibrio coralliilyticus]MCC2525567.1 NPP1 family protein [Vibrio coralliilyticus]